MQLPSLISNSILKLVQNKVSYKVFVFLSHYLFNLYSFGVSYFVCPVAKRNKVSATAEHLLGSEFSSNRKKMQRME